MRLDDPTTRARLLSDLHAHASAMRAHEAACRIKMTSEPGPLERAMGRATGASAEDQVALAHLHAAAAALYEAAIDEQRHGEAS